MVSFKNNILRSIAGLLVISLLAAPYAQAEDAKYSSLVIDADTGAVLHQENAGKQRYPASLTKMMTLYLTFQALESGTLTMNKQLRASSHVAAQKPSVIGLRPGQVISVQDAIHAVIIKSANDASVVLAEGVSGSERQFAVQMTRVAKSLGMNHTTFTNASGLPDSRQVTTAYDLARLAVALRRDYPKYYPLFANGSFTYNGRTYFSHNRVTKSYRGADGLKTGYIRASGFNLVTSARRGDKKIVGVVMGGRSIKSRDTNMVKLLDQAFYKMSRNNNLSNVEILDTKSSANKETSYDNQTENSDDEDSSAELTNIPVPKFRNNAPDTNKPQDKNATAQKASFSRDVVASEDTIPPQKERRDLFSPGKSVANTLADNTSAGKPAIDLTDNIKPTRVKVRGKEIPLPTFKPTDQEKGLVNTNTSPRGSRQNNLHFALADKAL